MKLFSCTNKQCKSNTPFDAESNRIAERIVADHKLNAEGEIDESKEPKVVKIEYVCKRCGAKAIEVPLKKVMKAKVTEVGEEYIFGKFQNKLRGKEVFNFRIKCSNGEVGFENLQSKKPERDFVREYYKLFYKQNIETEVIDAVTDKAGDKTYEVELYNKDEDIRLNVYIKDNEMVDYDGEREPNEIEKEKSIKKVVQCPY